MLLLLQLKKKIFDNILNKSQGRQPRARHQFLRCARGLRRGAAAGAGAGAGGRRAVPPPHPPAGAGGRQAAGAGLAGRRRPAQGRLLRLGGATATELLEDFVGKFL